MFSHVMQFVDSYIFSTLPITAHRILPIEKYMYVQCF